MKLRVESTQHQRGVFVPDVLFSDNPDCPTPEKHLTRGRYPLPHSTTPQRAVVLNAQLVPWGHNGTVAIVGMGESGCDEDDDKHVEDADAERTEESKEDEAFFLTADDTPAHDEVGVASEAELSMGKKEGEKAETKAGRGKEVERRGCADVGGGERPTSVDPDKDESDSASAGYGGKFRTPPTLRAGKSKFRGVSWIKKTKRWISQIGVHKGKQTYLGTFKTEKEAALAYNGAARRLGRPAAWLNDIPDDDDTIVGDRATTTTGATMGTSPEGEGQTKISDCWGEGGEGGEGSKGGCEGDDGGDGGEGGDGSEGGKYVEAGASGMDKSAPAPSLSPATSGGSDKCLDIENSDLENLRVEDDPIDEDEDVNEDEDDFPIATSALMPKKKPSVVASEMPATCNTPEFPWASDTLLALLGQEGKSLEKMRHSSIVALVWKRIHRNKLQVIKGVIDATDDPLMWKFFGERKLKNDEMSKRNNLVVQITRVVSQHVKRTDDNTARANEPGYSISVWADANQFISEDNGPRHGTQGVSSDGEGQDGGGRRGPRLRVDNDSDDVPSSGYEQLQMSKREKLGEIYPNENNIGQGSSGAGGGISSYGLDTDDSDEASEDLGGRRQGRDGSGRSTADRFAAITRHNIQLVYLRREDLEKLLAVADDIFERATHSTYIRIRVNSGGYRLVQITKVDTTSDGSSYYVNPNVSALQSSKEFIVTNMGIDDRYRLCEVSNAPFQARSTGRRPGLSCLFSLSPQPVNRKYKILPHAAES